MKTLLALLLALLPAPLLHAQSSSVDIALDSFGLDGVWRPGSFTAIRVQLTALPQSSLETVTSAWVQWDVTNADGDIAEYGRPVTLTKGQARTAWLYAPLPPHTVAGSVFPVRVYEYNDGVRGREIGGVRIRPSPRGVEISTGLIGVVGPTQMGLDQLGLSTLSGGAAVFTAHEDVRGAFGLDPTDICDRWEGLSAFEALAWSGALPQDLGSAQADAIREWVRRGGHLVVSLPEDTNPWGLGEPGKTDLEDLMPATAPRKDEDVSLEDILPIMCKAKGLTPTAYFPLSIRVFAEIRGSLDQIRAPWQPLVALPDGRVVVVQRTFGHGRVTVIGIDLSNKRLTGGKLLTNGIIAGLPQADVFWSPILGRRADTPTVGEIMAIEGAERLARGTPNEEQVGSGRAIRQEINLSGPAGTGLGLALLLFLVYWIAAGPGGFALLKMYKRAHHAWVAFAAAAGLFTALAWGGVNVLRENSVRVRHFTVLDHISRDVDDERGESDPQLQRAVSWLSMYLPGYDDAAIGIESLPGSAAVPAQRDLLASWTPPAEATQRFPNADRYLVDVSRDVDDYRLPSRSTATQLYANWLGGVDRSWGGLLRSDPADPVRVDPDTGMLRGAFINELPGDLRDVKMIFVSSRREPRRAYDLDDGKEAAWIRNSGHLPNVGRMFAHSLIPAGSTYIIPRTTPGENGLANNISQKYVRPFEVSNPLGAPTGSITPDRRMQYLEMLSLYHQLDPPKYVRTPGGQTPETMVARRLMGRELDLSAWFTRPCLIVIGYLHGTECPIPLRVDGDPVHSEGTTVVRWILPLELDVAEAFPAVEQSGIEDR